MRTVERVQTIDGQLHETLEAATRHAEKVYGLALSKLAGEMLKIEKYIGMQEFIDGSLDEFVRLAALKNDIRHEGEC